LRKAVLEGKKEGRGKRYAYISVRRGEGKKERTYNLPRGWGGESEKGITILHL